MTDMRKTASRRRGHAATNRCQALLDEKVRELGRSSRLLSDGLTTGPTCPVATGAAGIAYFFAHLARLEGSEELLALAGLWNERALHSFSDPQAFENPELKLTRGKIGEVSLYFSEPGVRCVGVLVSLARTDYAGAGVSLRSFLAAARRPSQHLDLIRGRAGLLLGCAMIAAVARLHPAFDASPVMAFGNQLYDELWSRVSSYAPVRQCQEIESLGMAVGWAGLLLALMRWVGETGRELPPGLEMRLAELADYQNARGGWPTRRAPRPSDLPLFGWCNGSAGHVYLWLLAYQLTGEPRWLEVAWRSGSHTSPLVEMQGGLCCGPAGQAYALAKLYRATGERSWLKRARELGELAASLSGQVPWFRNSLWKGDLGVALLAADLAHPDRSRTPFFDWDQEPQPIRPADPS
jgi:serine/threonine-protein kinase